MIGKTTSLKCQLYKCNAIPIRISTGFCCKEPGKGLNNFILKYFEGLCKKNKKQKNVKLVYSIKYLKSKREAMHIEKHMYIRDDIQRGIFITYKEISQFDFLKGQI